MVTIGRLEAEVELWPLLFGDVRVGRLVLIGLDAVFETDAKGRGNWEFAAVATEKPKAETTEEAAGGPGMLPVVNRVLVRDVRIAYVSGPGKRPLTVVLESLDAGAEGVDAPLELALKGAYDGIPFGVSGKLGSTRQLLGGEALSVALKGEALGASIAIEGSVDQLRQAGGIEVSLKLAGDELTKTLKALSALIPFPADTPPIGPYRLSARLKGSPERLSIGDLALSLGNPERVLVTVGGSIEDAAKAKGLALDLVVEGRDLAPLAKAAGVELGEFPSFRISGKVTDPAGGYAFAPFQAKVGVSDLEGRLAVSLAGKRPRLQARLESKLLDLDQLMPGGGEALPEEDADGKRVFPGQPLVLDGLRAVDAGLEFRADRLLAGGVDLGAVEASLDLRDGRLEVKPFEATVAGGRLAVELSVDASKSRIAVKADIRDLDLGRLPKDLGLSEILSVRLNAALDVSGSGASVAAIMSGLEGQHPAGHPPGTHQQQGPRRRRHRHPRPHALGRQRGGQQDQLPGQPLRHQGRGGDQPGPGARYQRHDGDRQGTARSRGRDRPHDGVTEAQEHQPGQPGPAHLDRRHLRRADLLPGRGDGGDRRGRVRRQTSFPCPWTSSPPLHPLPQGEDVDDACVKALGGSAKKSAKAREKKPPSQKGPESLMEGIGKGIRNTLEGLFQ